MAAGVHALTAVRPQPCQAQRRGIPIPKRPANVCHDGPALSSRPLDHGAAVWCDRGRGRARTQPLPQTVQAAIGMPVWS